MKLCVFGSRNFTDYLFLKSKLDAIHNEIPITEIVSGKAKGADSLGERWAKENKVKVCEFVADWDKLGKKAGPIRNEKMAKYCDKGAGFSINQSRGTANMKNNLEKLGKFCWFWEIGNET